MHFKIMRLHRHGMCNKSFLLHLIQIGLIAQCSILNEQPLNETTVCATKNLDIICQKNRKMIIDSYKAGAKKDNACRVTDPRYSESCCTKNAINDCLIPINDTTAYRACTGKSTCQLPPKQSRVSCGNESYPINYQNLQYYCIEDSRFGDCTSSVLKSCKPGQTLYLTNPGYPFNVTGPVGCVCSISLDCDKGIDVLKIDVQVSWKDYMRLDHSGYNVFVSPQDNGYKLSYLFTSFSNSILLNATLNNGRFLIAFNSKDACTLNIKCPINAKVTASNCDKTVSTLATQSSTINVEMVSNATNEASYSYMTSSEGTQSYGETTEATTRNLVNKTSTDSNNAQQKIKKEITEATTRNLVNKTSTDRNNAQQKNKKEINFPWYAVVIPILFLTTSCASIIFIFKYKKRLVLVTQEVNSSNNQVLVPPYSNNEGNNRNDRNNAAVVDTNNGYCHDTSFSDGKQRNIIPHSSTINGNSNVPLLPPLHPFSYDTNENEGNVSRPKKKKKKRKKHKEQENNGNSDIGQQDVNDDENGKDNAKKKKKKRKKHKRDKVDTETSVMASEAEPEVSINATEQDIVTNSNEAYVMTAEQTLYSHVSERSQNSTQSLRQIPNDSKLDSNEENNPTTKKKKKRKHKHKADDTESCFNEDH